MMRADNTAHLRDAAQYRHEQARNRTLRALDALREENAAVTVAGLARAAGVARSWIYTQPDLIENIRAQDNVPPRPSHLARGTESSEASWRQRLELAHNRLKELTHENTQLRAQLAHAYGQLRAFSIAPPKTLSTSQNT
jgi:hypothetical protein